MSARATEETTCWERHRRHSSSVTAVDEQGAAPFTPTDDDPPPEECNEELLDDDDDDDDEQLLLSYTTDKAPAVLMMNREGRSSSSSAVGSSRWYSKNEEYTTTGATTIAGPAMTVSSSWSCHACTFQHEGSAKRLFLTCEVCGAGRRRHQQATEQQQRQRRTQRFASSSSSSPVPPANAKKRSRTTWGSLRPPTARDIHGKRRRRKALDGPPPLLDYLVVLDFEWTADDKRRMEPVPEITQFPSVVLTLVEKNKDKPLTVPPPRRASGTTHGLCLPLSRDLTQPVMDESVRQDALAIAAFDSFVRPTLNPVLSAFSVNLTAITQDHVDAAPTMDIVLDRYMAWLQSLHLVDTNGHRQGNWCFVTWGDGDIMNTLRRELAYKSIRLPPCFDRWINLKNDSVFQKHYGREPRGGLQACVRSVGATWEGRAHNGYVDCINTAKIVRHMVQTGFRFTRSTRGIGKDGVPFGQKR